MQPFSQNAPTILNSWKEISAYLGRGVRTAQRWEREQGMPVHRIGQGVRSPVFAVAQELYIWLSTIDSEDILVNKLKPADGNPEPLLASVQTPKELAVPSSSILCNEARALRATTSNSLYRVRASAELAAKQLTQTKDLLQRFRVLSTKRGLNFFNPGA